MARREYKRQAQREIKSIVNKAKEAMYKWMVDLGREPSREEAAAWQSGYLAGVSQANKD